MDECSQNEWKKALSLIAKWEKGSVHLDDLAEKMDFGRSHWLVMDLFRNWLVIEYLLKKQFHREPRPHAKNLLRLAVCEILNREADKHSRIVHHAVETGKAVGLSRAECGFVNGVLRSLLRDQGNLREIDIRLTHPDWLVKRWEDQFGGEAAMQLMQWNQKIPKLIIHADRCPGYAEPTRWEGFFEIGKGCFAAAVSDLAKGLVYMQDPFTRIPVELLSINPGENILDLCAAPGGKTRLLAKAMSGKGNLLAVDKPGPRTKRLQENVALSGHGNIRVLGRRLDELDSRDLEKFIGRRQADAALIDVPCSNTGVIQKRPDVKLRLDKQAISGHAAAQGRLLGEAARLVRPGGRLVYSTCSIDTAENSGVVDAFLRENPGWQLQQSVTSLPWECEHDGGAAFLLTRSLGN